MGMKRESPTPFKRKRESLNPYIGGDESESSQSPEFVSATSLGEPSSSNSARPINGRRKREKKSVDAYGSPHGVHRLIELLEPKQRQSILEIGFGGLLKLRATGFYQAMVPFLLESYHKDSCMFYIDKSKQCAVTPHDVYDIFMLPYNEGNKVEEASHKRNDNPDLELFQTWRDKFGVGPKEEISAEALATEMLRLKEGGDEFKRYFVLYAMATLLVPTAHNKIDLHLVKAVTDVHQIGKLDWCSYVLDKLGDVVDTWKSKRTKNVGGCLLILQLIYFHHLTWRGCKAPCEIPLIQHWTYKNMKKRVNEENLGAKKSGGRYGMGEWDNTTYPVSGKHDIRPSTKPLQVMPIQSVNPSRIISFILPPDLSTDEEIRQQSTNEYVQAWLMMKRDMEVILHHHIEQVKTLKSKSKNRNDADFQEIDSMLDKLREANSVLSIMPSFDLDIEEELPDEEVP